MYTAAHKIYGLLWPPRLEDTMTEDEMKLYDLSEHRWSSERHP